MKIAVVQMNSGLDVPANIGKACRYIDEAAAERGADLVLLPEFFNTIFFAQYRDGSYHDLAEPETGRTITAMRERALANRVSVVATIYEEVERGLYFDTAMVIDRAGEIVFKYRKVHPAAVQSLEKIYFRYGTRFETVKVEDWRVGIGVCYDMAFPETARCLSIAGSELILSPYATPRTRMFQEVLRTRAFENGCYLAAANKVGREGDWTFGGLSLIADPSGTVLASADFESEALLVADIDPAAVTKARIAFPSRRDRRPDLYGAIATEIDAKL